jgi:hypothetical protein
MVIYVNMIIYSIHIKVCICNARVCMHVCMYVHAYRCVCASASARACVSGHGVFNSQLIRTTFGMELQNIYGEHLSGSKLGGQTCFWVMIVEEYGRIFIYININNNSNSISSSNNNKYTNIACMPSTGIEHDPSRPGILEADAPSLHSTQKHDNRIACTLHTYKNYLY